MTGSSQPWCPQVPFQVTRRGGATASVMWPALHEPRTFTPADITTNPHCQLLLSLSPSIGNNCSRKHRGTYFKGK
jgi:hypothetical protein